MVMSKSKKRNYIFFAVILLFFLGMGYNGPLFEADSESYITMNTSREPLYPLFLALFRVIFGTKIYLWVVCIVQCILAGITIYYLTKLLLEKFNIRFGWGYLIAFMLTVPYWIDTIWYLPMGIRTNRILTEGIVISIFYLYLAFLLKAIWDKSFTALAVAMACVFLMVSSRTHMFITVVPLLIAIFVCMYRTEWKQRIKVIVSFVLMLVLILGLQKGYNSVITENTQSYPMNKLTVLTNFLFVADEDDAERFENPDLKKFFIVVLDRIKEDGAGASEAQGLVATAEQLHKYHDHIKYQIMNEVYREYTECIGSFEGKNATLTHEEIITGLYDELMFANMGEWLYVCTATAYKGFIKSIFIASNGIIAFSTIFSVLAYMTAILLSIYLLKRKEYSAPIFMGVVLIFIGVNVVGVALTIFDIIRYYIYSIGIFYVAGFCLLSRIPATQRFICKKKTRKE